MGMIPQKQSVKPVNHLFELLEMEVSRHKSHTLQNYLTFMTSDKNSGSNVTESPQVTESLQQVQQPLTTEGQGT